MKKSYYETVDELTMAHFRLAELSGTVDREKWSGLVLPIGLILGFLISLHGNMTEALILAIPPSLMVVLYHFLTYKNNLRKRIRRAMVSAIGNDSPYLCECELDDAGITIRQHGRECKSSWTNLVDVNIRDDSLEAIMRPSSVAVIPRRVFLDENELNEWYSFMERQKSRQSAQHTP